MIVRAVISTSSHQRRALISPTRQHLPDPDGPHDIVVEFTPRMAPYVTSRTSHDSQRIEMQLDGSVRVSLRVAALAPVCSWVLELGPEAVALAPPSSSR